MNQVCVGRCSICSGKVYGERESPLAAIGFREGDHCTGCGAVATIVMKPSEVSVAPGVEVMRDFAVVARRGRC